MRNFRRIAVCTLLLCLCAVPAAARGVHMVLKVNLAAVEADRRGAVITASIEVLSRRLAGLGAASATVSQKGADRIVAEIPGYSDLARIRELFDLGGQPIGFRLVDEDVTDDDIRAGRVPDGVELLEQRGAHPGGHKPPLAVYRSEIISGERITDATRSLDPQIGEPAIRFRFDSLGTRQFEKVTEDNVGKRFAIVFKGQVISAPVIRDPIRGGAGEIAGDFTEKEASDLVTALRAGALPAPWTVVELKETP